MDSDDKIKKMDKDERILLSTWHHTWRF